MIPLLEKKLARICHLEIFKKTKKLWYARKLILEVRNWKLAGVAFPFD
jgi:hypothetical protein